MVKFLKRYYLLVILIMLTVTMVACASSRRGSYLERRNKGTHINTSQLGKNRYFFSKEYQRKLKRSMRRKK